MSKPLFTPEYLYGRMLQLMYEYPHIEFRCSELLALFPEVDKNNLFDQLRKLESDQLVIGRERMPENNPDIPEDDPFFLKSFRITNTGYVFIYELKKARKSDAYALSALLLSGLSLLISIYLALQPLLIPAQPDFYMPDRVFLEPDDRKEMGMEMEDHGVIGSVDSAANDVDLPALDTANLGPAK